jgi:hypothetical protein
MGGLRRIAVLPYAASLSLWYDFCSRQEWSISMRSSERLR